MSKRHRAIADRLFKEAEAGYRCAYGMTRAERMALERRCKAGRAVEVASGYYIRADLHKALPKRGVAMYLIRAVARRHPMWVFASYSAALVHGLQVHEDLMLPLHFAVGKQGNRRRMQKGAICHELGIDEVTVIDGMRVTTIERTLLDCLRATDFRRGLAIADSALHWGLVDKDALTRYVARSGDRLRGMDTVGKVLKWANDLSENGGESVARAVMIELGFQVPELQVEVPDPLSQNVCKRVDFYWRLPGGRVIIGELDGKRKYLSGSKADIDAAIEVLTAERLRESRLSLTGATVVRFSYRQATDAVYMRQLLTCAGVPRASEGASAAA